MSKHRIAAAAAGGIVTVAALTGALVPAATAGAAPSTHAAQKAHSTVLVMTGGTTTVALDPNTAAALKKAGIKVKLASEARMTKGGIAFPITGGVLNAKTAGGFINHSGGLIFGNGTKKITIRDFRINTVHKGLSAYADAVRARLRVFNLGLAHAGIAAKGNRLIVTNVKVTLNGKAAAALNAYFKTSLFSGGLSVGKATVNAKVRALQG